MSAGADTGFFQGGGGKRLMFCKIKKKLWPPWPPSEKILWWPEPDFFLFFWLIKNNFQGDFYVLQTSRPLPKSFMGGGHRRPGPPLVSAPAVCLLRDPAVQRDYLCSSFHCVTVFNLILVTWETSFIIIKHTLPEKIEPPVTLEVWFSQFWRVE